MNYKTEIELLKITLTADQFELLLRALEFGIAKSPFYKERVNMRELGKQLLEVNNYTKNNY